MSDCILAPVHDKRTRHGYAYARRNGKRYFAHRLALEDALGRPIRPGCVAMHECDVRDCIRVGPGHIREGTYAENNADCRAKGRHCYGDAMRAAQTGKMPTGDAHHSRMHPERMPRGDAHYTRKHAGSRRGVLNGNAKLTEQDVRAIKCRLADPEGGSCRQIGAAFGVLEGAIYNIKHGKTWKHVT